MTAKIFTEHNLHFPKEDLLISIQTGGSVSYLRKSKEIWAYPFSLTVGCSPMNYKKGRKESSI